MTGFGETVVVELMFLTGQGRGQVPPLLYGPEFILREQRLTAGDANSLDRFWSATTPAPLASALAMEATYVSAAAQIRSLPPFKIWIAFVFLVRGCCPVSTPGSQ